MLSCQSLKHNGTAFDDDGTALVYNDVTFDLTLQGQAILPKGRAVLLKALDIKIHI